MFRQDSNKNILFNQKHMLHKILVGYLICILAMGTVLPTVCSASLSLYSGVVPPYELSAVNQPPTFGIPTPGNGSGNNPLNLTWSIPINDPEGDLFSWSIQCNNGQLSNGCGQSNGTKSLSLSGLTYSVTYKVWVNATDSSGSGLYTRRWFTFTTKANLTTNNPPVFGVPSPSNGSTGNLLSLSWSIPISDPEGNSFSWTIQCNNTQTNSSTGATNGTKHLVLSGLAYSVPYKVWVNATDPSGSGLYTRRWFTFTTRGNSPPVFGTPSPSNGSTGNLLSLSWSIPINDPEGNPFSWTIQCSNNQVNSGTSSSNGSKSLSLSGLSYATTYKIWVNATDPTGSGLYTRKWYTFTTKPLPPMKVLITKPLENTLYIRDQERRSLSTNTIIYGPITITANVTSEIEVDRVEFYINGRLKETVTTPPYTYKWNPIIQFHGVSLKHTITVIAYDILGHNASDEINVTKWRFHPLPFIAGVGIASSLLLFFKHTTVTGVFLNLQESPLTTSFYAIRVHYKTSSPFKHSDGVIRFKSCTGGPIIGPIYSIQTGPHHTVLYGTFTFLGDIQYSTRGFQQEWNTTHPPTSTVTLKAFLQVLQSYDWKHTNC